MNRNKSFALLAILIIFFSGCRGQETLELRGAGDRIPAHLDTAIHGLADSAFKQARTQGIIVGVLYRGARRFYSMGYADAANRLVFDSTTSFEIGSITKTLTAYVLLSVLKENNIEESTPVLSYLPGRVQKNAALARISFLSLLNHSSGLPRLPDDIFSTTANPMQPYANYDSSRLFNYLETVIPGEDGKSNYSNLGYAIAGTLAERISGLSYEELLQKFILRPFELKQTSTLIPQKANLAKGKFNNINAEYWHMTSFAGAGMLKSTAADMLSYLQKSIHPPDADSRRIIERLTEGTLTLAPKLKVARGWHMLEETGQPTIFWHNGGTYGFSTFAAFEKSTDCGVIIVLNAFNKNSICDPLGFRIIKQLIR